jgi:hypothetical protein
MRGGRREGAGRPQGARNKRTVEAEEAMKAVVQEFSATVPDAFAGDAVAFLQTVYKDPRIPLHVRLDAAAKAARFERPMCVAKAARSERPTPETNHDHATNLTWSEADDELIEALTREVKAREGDPGDGDAQ